MTDIIQINATWGIDMNALRGILIVGKPLSKRELFTKHGVMIKDGMPYTGDNKGNVGTNTMNNFINWLGQCASYTQTSNKIEIINIKSVSAISHTTRKLLYKPYIESLFYDYINKEYETSFINEPPQYMTMSIEQSMVNDYFPQAFNTFGNMYNIFTASYYDSTLKEYLFSNYEIYNRPYYRYIMRSLRNSIIQNIDNSINAFSALGMNKSFVYSINGNPLTKIQYDFINDNYIKFIRYNDVINGFRYSPNLTGEINRQLKKDFEDSTKVGIISTILQISEFSPICQTWQIKIDRQYNLITPKVNIDFSRKKLNENAIQKIKDISGYDTILKFYNTKNKGFIVPKDVLNSLRNFYFTDNYLRDYVNDLETMMNDIA